MNLIIVPDNADRRADLAVHGGERWGPFEGYFIVRNAHPEVVRRAEEAGQLVRLPKNHALSAARVLPRLPATLRGRVAADARTLGDALADLVGDEDLL